jgi:hypothetical protein
LIARQIAPHDRATLFGQILRKRPINVDEAVLDELLDLRVAQRTRRLVVRHRCLAVIKPAPVAPRSADGAAVSAMAVQLDGCVRPVLPVAADQRPRKKTEAMLSEEIIMVATGYSFQASGQ